MLLDGLWSWWQICTHHFVTWRSVWQVNIYQRCPLFPFWGDPTQEKPVFSAGKIHLCPRSCLVVGFLGVAGIGSRAGRMLRCRLCFAAASQFLFSTVCCCWCCCYLHSAGACSESRSQLILRIPVVGSSESCQSPTPCCCLRVKRRMLSKSDLSTKSIWKTEAIELFSLALI